MKSGREQNRGGREGDLMVIISFLIPILIYQQILFAPHIKQIYTLIHFHPSLLLLMPLSLFS